VTDTRLTDEQGQPVWRACLVCGIAVQADPIDLAYEDEDEDAAEYICVACAGRGTTWNGKH
jgi:hypothetical protein